MKEFFGLGGYTRTPEGAYSWQHLLFVGLLLVTMVTLAIFLGIINKNKEENKKNIVLIWSAILIDGFELLKIVIACINAGTIFKVLDVLPLFLCSIQLITIPVAAFTKGRIKDAALDFVLIFGILGAIFGTIGAAQNYNSYPVLSFDNVVSGVTHSISGFASIYIGVSGMLKLKKENLWICLSILGVFCVLAYIANLILETNYMFLMSHDGTPYSIFYNLVNGSPILYPLIVVAVFVIYIVGFYYIYYLIINRKNKSKVLD